MSAKEPWRLSKSVPVSLIFAIIIQAAAIVAAGTAMRSDIDGNRAGVMRLEGRTSTLEQSNREQAILLARMDENIKAIRRALERPAP